MQLRENYFYLHNIKITHFLIAIDDPSIALCHGCYKKKTLYKLIEGEGLLIKKIKRPTDFSEYNCSERLCMRTAKYKIKLRKYTAIEELALRDKYNVNF